MVFVEKEQIISKIQFLKLGIFGVTLDHSFEAMPRKHVPLRVTSSQATFIRLSLSLTEF